MNEQSLSREAAQYMRKHAKELIQKFANDKDFPSTEYPSSFFMAGSPGAGKTEFSKRLMEPLKDDWFVRIDPDEIRDELPQYTGGNAYLFQNAISIGVDELFSYVLKSNKNFILDGTFANFEKSARNVKKVIGKRGHAIIFYMYQDPVRAWEFTKLRERKEGRNIPKDEFVKMFFDARKNVHAVKEKFGEGVGLFLVRHDFMKGRYTFFEDVKDVDSYIPLDYTENDLKKLIM